MRPRTLVIIGLLVLVVGAVGARWVWGFAQDALFIDPGGNVGIGTSTPGERLEVQGRARVGNALVGPWPAEGHYVFFGAAALDQKNRGNYALMQSPGGGEAGHTYLNSPSKIHFRIANTEAMSLASESNAARFSVLGRVDAQEFVGQGAIPKGGIIMWSGAPDRVPAGWCLCDGGAGTPDLRGRFIVGHDPRDSDYQRIGNTGGEKRHTLTVQEMPSHTHTGPTNKTEPPFRKVQGIGNSWGLGWGSDVGEHNQGTHDHGFTTQATGGGQAFENRPPYYTLAYILYKGGACQ
jgi:baseplate structural protein gp10